MRLFEFTQIDEYLDKTPVKNQQDPDSGLWLNEKGETWRSSSPYLYAIKNPSGRPGYVGQIHIPASLYREHIQDMQRRWPDAPSSLFSDDLNKLMPILTPVYSDPRKAAWVAQEVLLDTGNKKAEDIILGYLDWRYSGRHDKNDAHLWFELLNNVPSFTGQPLTGDDADEYLGDKEQLAKDRAEREAALKKKITLAKNAGNYESDRKKQIKRDLMAWFTRMGPAVAKKKFGKPLTGEELSAKLDKEIEDKGINFFLTGPGSVKLKDIGSLKF